jgi:phosphatidylethanolamine-binding protein (PEBP) family uncharacterized protein
LTITPANSSVTTTGNYTIAMVDAGPVGTDQAAGQTRHWLVNGATISGEKPPSVSCFWDLFFPIGGSVSFDSAVVITDYAGPGPPPGSGPHRYAFLLLAIFRT